MSSVYLGIGHGGTDSGACGYVIEKDVNLLMGLACRDYLTNRGVKVYISRETDKDVSIGEKTIQANYYNVDYALDLHANAGGGTGSEVFHSVLGGQGQKLATNVLNQICKLGYLNRGIKTKVGDNGSDYFGFIRQTKMPAIITEPFFVDYEPDTKKATPQQIGEAIAKGILDTLGIKYENEKMEKSGTNKTIKDTIYRVQVGAFKDKANAERLSKELKSKGYEAIVK